MEPFVTLAFRGTRFDGAAMPVEALPELQAYRELVLAVARDLFLTKYPSRQKVPKGFESSFRLVMVGVTKGSTIPIVSRLSATAPRGVAARQVAMFGSEDDLFSEARDVVEEVIASVGSRGRLSRELRSDTLARFGAFGRTLDESEAILIGKPGRKAGTRYDRAVRKKLVALAGGSYEEPVVVTGEVRAADRDAQGFGLRIDGRRVFVTCPPLFLPTAITSLSGSAEVVVRGIGVHDGDGNILRISAIDVSLTEDQHDPPPECPTSIEDQVAELKALRDGWFDSSSKAYDPDTLDTFRALLADLVRTLGMTTPWIYPTPEGAIRVEWTADDREVVASFDLTRRVVDAFVVYADNHRTEELSVNLSDVGSETRLGRFLQDALWKVREGTDG